jgi:hypothetical protein
MKLKQKLDTATHAGVLCLSNRMGKIGSLLRYVSTKAKDTRATKLMTDRPHTNGLLQGISSAVLNVTATRREPTAKTSVKDPSQSMRASFPRNVDSFDGSGTSTLHRTKAKDIARIGIWSRNAQRLVAATSVTDSRWYNQTHHPKASFIKPPT